VGSVLEKKRELDHQIERYKELNEQLENALEIITHNPNVVDGIQLASELGRLDIVSLILGVFGLVVGILGFGGFWMIRGAALEAARDEARKEINAKASEMFEQAVKLIDSGQQKSSLDVSQIDVEAIISKAEEVKED